MRQLTRTGADALKRVLEHSGSFEMESIEYPQLFVLHKHVHGRRNSFTGAEVCVDHVLVNIRGKHHASYWNKGKREEFGIPAVEFATYTEMAKQLSIPLYFIFYEERSKTLSCISSNEVLLFARLWEKDNVDPGGTLFVPKGKVMPLARLLDEGEIRFINQFNPKNEIRGGIT